jgi:hypothetical protein
MNKWRATHVVKITGSLYDRDIAVMAVYADTGRRSTDLDTPGGKILYTREEWNAADSADLEYEDDELYFQGQPGATSGNHEWAISPYQPKRRKP